MRTLVTPAVVLFVAATLAPAARADGGPSPGVGFDGPGITDDRGSTYATTQAGNLSSLVVRDHAGRVIRSRTFDGLYGIPYVTFGGAKAGLSCDGRRDRRRPHPGWRARPRPVEPPARTGHGDATNAADD